MTGSKSAARVAIVDDSRSIRRWLRCILDGDDRLNVVGEAGSADEARALLRSTPVDVVTLDVDMPGMSGLQFLSRVMELKPMPVVMLSALTERGSQEAVEALALGAVDCIEKPKAENIAGASADICNRVFDAAQVTVQGRRRRAAAGGAAPKSSTEAPWHGDVILIGASTGGVTAIESILAALDGTPWPVVIAQHMPENFLRSFQRRLNEHLSRRVYMAQDGHVLKSGQAVVALGKTQSTRLRRNADQTVTCHLGAPSEAAVYRPNVNDLFVSAAQNGVGGAAALLTGMGQDGAEGLKCLQETGVCTFAESEESCVVFGMPKAAIDLGAADHVLAHDEIGKRLAKVAQAGSYLKRGVVT